MLSCFVATGSFNYWVYVSKGSNCAAADHLGSVNCPVSGRTSLLRKPSSHELQPLLVRSMARHLLWALCTFLLAHIHANALSVIPSLCATVGLTFRFRVFFCRSLLLRDDPRHFYSFDCVGLHRLRRNFFGRNYFAVCRLSVLSLQELYREKYNMFQVSRCFYMLTAHIRVLICLWLCK